MALSSSTIVTTDLVTAPSVAPPAGLLRLTVKYLLPLADVLSVIGTVKVLEVSPGAKVRVPLLEPYCDPPHAGWLELTPVAPSLVDYWTLTVPSAPPTRLTETVS